MYEENEIVKECLTGTLFFGITKTVKRREMLSFTNAIYTKQFKKEVNRFDLQGSERAV